MRKSELSGARALAHWEAEQETLGPGLQAVVLWSRLCVERGRGSVLEDVDGRELLDFMGASGVNVLGHAHPRFVEAMREEVGRAFIGGYASPARLELLERLRTILPPPLDTVQLYTSGAEAVEAALRLVAAATGRTGVLGFWDGFHGKTAGAASIGASVRGAVRGIESVQAPFANCYRCPLRLKHPACGLACVDLVRDALRQHGPENIGAIVVEPLQGRAGNVAPPPGYLAALQELAAEHDMLLVCDEMITGFGRTGSMFAAPAQGIVPDVIIAGKALGGGYPITAVISRRELMDARPFSEPSASSSSFGGFPLACRAAAVTLEVLVEEDLVARAARLGDVALERLHAATADSPIAGDVRGRGLMLAVELVEDRETRRRASAALVERVFCELCDRGVVTMLGGGCLRLYPALTIPEDQLLAGIDTIGAVLREVA